MGSGRTRAIGGDSGDRNICTRREKEFVFLRKKEE